MGDDQPGGRLLLEKLVDAGQRAEGVHAQPPIGNGGKARVNRATPAEINRRTLNPRKLLISRTRSRTSIMTCRMLSIRKKDSENRRLKTDDKKVEPTNG